MQCYYYCRVTAENCNKQRPARRNCAHLKDDLSPFDAAVHELTHLIKRAAKRHLQADRTAVIKA